MALLEEVTQFLVQQLEALARTAIPDGVRIDSRTTSLPLQPRRPAAKRTQATPGR